VPVAHDGDGWADRRTNPKHHRSQRCRERTCSFVPPLRSTRSGGRHRMRTGLARADIGSLREIRGRREATRSIARDGGMTSIRVRPRLANGLDVMEGAVVFAACSISPNGLPKPHSYPAAGPQARSGRDRVGVVCLCLVSGWRPRAAMVPTLHMGVGGHRPQFPVTESRCGYWRDRDAALNMPILWVCEGRQG